MATDILADYAADQPQALADLLMDADEKQFAVIYPRFKDRGEKGLPILMTEIAKALPKELPSSDDKLAKRQANAAVALLRMNKPANVWPLLQHSPDPRVRSSIIHKLGPLGADANAIVKQMEDEKDISIRRAMLLSLGEFGEKELTPEDCKALLPELQATYRNDADSGIHAASEWLLREWEKKGWLEKDWLKKVNDEWAKDEEQRAKRLASIGKLLTKEKEKAPSQWYVNNQGQTLVVIPGPVEFQMGSPKTEKDRIDRQEVQHKRRIGRSFAIAAKSVTLEEYRSLTKDKYEINDEKYTRYPDLPVVGISWYMAAKYCNLLSKREGLDECYEIKGTAPDYKGSRLKENYLSLSGYRLPTEAEMEYATRAGAITSRYYGETDELLGHYAWYTKNTGDLPQRVGRKKPNDFGLFDVQGNCYTWCQNLADATPAAEQDKAVEDKEGGLVVISTELRALRGGTSNGLASNVRPSALRVYNVPTNRLYSVGFRPSRTFTP